jgi:hypothetical protein
MRRTSEAQAEIVEGRELLLLWYRRWQGSLSHVSPKMIRETQAYIERNGGSIPEPVFAIAGPVRLK